MQMCKQLVISQPRRHQTCPSNTFPVTQLLQYDQQSTRQTGGCVSGDTFIKRWICSGCVLCFCDPGGASAAPPERQILSESKCRSSPCNRGSASAFDPAVSPPVSHLWIHPEDDRVKKCRISKNRVKVFTVDNESRFKGFPQFPTPDSGSLFKISASSQSGIVLLGETKTAGLTSAGTQTCLSVLDGKSLLLLLLLPREAADADL